MAGSRRKRGSLERRAERATFVREVYLPLHGFIQTEWIGSVLLLVAAVVALAWANSPWVEAYHHLWEIPLGFELGGRGIRMDLHHWVNDGLMALFFFVVGLEIKREVLHGELSDPREAALPGVAALGGMVVPALIYFAFNRSGPEAAGWGIPMATDIAFALGVLGLVGRRIPSAVRVFLLALAIVDDIGAILVIAVFYTEALALDALGIAAMLLGVIFLCQRVEVRSVGVYLLLGIGVWVAVYLSGIHATIAGVVLGFVTPAKAVFAGPVFLEPARGLLDRLEAAVERDDHPDIEATLGELEEMTKESEAPLERMERAVHPWSAYVVLPLFALANAGVELSSEALGQALSSPVTLGIVLGLIAGKVVGVTGAAWIAVRSGLALLPAGVRWSHLLGSALLAGIGFTVSLFITGLAFADPAIVDEAKIGVLGASLVAGVTGFLFLRFVAPAVDGDRGAA